VKFRFVLSYCFFFCCKNNFVEFYLTEDNFFFENAVDSARSPRCLPADVDMDVVVDIMVYVSVLSFVRV
jgi:hypothetical protein